MTHLMTDKPDAGEAARRIVERAKNDAQACHRPLVHPADNSRVAATLLDCADHILSSSRRIEDDARALELERKAGRDYALAQYKRIDELEKALGEIDALEPLEINPSNYTHDDVCELNRNAVQAALIARAALSPSGGGEMAQPQTASRSPASERSAK